MKIFLLLAVIGAVGAKKQCLDMKGNPVDWYAIYKLPELGSAYSKSKVVADGFGFLYMDANNYSSWQWTGISLEDKEHAVFHTLNQIYSMPDRSQDAFYMMYNDGNPNGTYSWTGGHSKGFMQFDTEGGYWMIHSVPKFPPRDKYFWPWSARCYGQSMLCINFDYTALNEIATQMTFVRPNVYSSGISAKIAADHPKIQEVIAGKHVTRPPYSSYTPIKSSGKKKFVTFAKSHGWGKDLYFDLVAPSLKVGLNTETWMNGEGNFTSWCNSSFPVHNVLSLSLPFDLNLIDHEDHSKWAVSTNPDKPWVCIGDINRQHGQLVRGGGTMCTMDHTLWKVYSQTVTNVEKCGLSREHEKSRIPRSTSYHCMYFP